MISSNCVDVPENSFKSECRICNEPCPLPFNSGCSDCYQLQETLNQKCQSSLTSNCNRDDYWESTISQVSDWNQGYNFCSNDRGHIKKCFPLRSSGAASSQAGYETLLQPDQANDVDHYRYSPPLIQSYNSVDEGSLAVSESHLLPPKNTECPVKMEIPRCCGSFQRSHSNYELPAEVASCSPGSEVWSDSTPRSTNSFVADSASLPSKTEENSMLDSYGNLFLESFSGLTNARSFDNCDPSIWPVFYIRDKWINHFEASALLLNVVPSNQSTNLSTNIPTNQLTNRSTNQLTDRPTNQPLKQPTFHPTFQSTFQPAFQPALQPVFQPTFQPAYQKKYQQTQQPTNLPPVLHDFDSPVWSSNPTFRSPQSFVDNFQNLRNLNIGLTLIKGEAVVPQSKVDYSNVKLKLSEISNNRRHSLANLKDWRSSDENYHLSSSLNMAPMTGVKTCSYLDFVRYSNLEARKMCCFQSGELGNSREVDEETRAQWASSSLPEHDSVDHSRLGYLDTSNNLLLSPIHSLKTDMSSSTISHKVGENGNKSCSNCGTKVTSLWRRQNVTGETICNACGLFFKYRGFNRPKSMKKDSIQHRRRKLANNVSSGKGIPRSSSVKTPSGMKSTAKGTRQK